MKIQDLLSNHIIEESATGGATSSGSVASVSNPAGGKPSSQVGSLFGGSYGEGKKKKSKVIKRSAIAEHKKGVRAVKHTVKPRNPVAKNANATVGGGAAGAHKDKKKADKQGYQKHKKQEMAEEINFDKIRKDAEANLKSTLDKQSNARLAAKRNPAPEPKEKSFLQKVGDKQIGMIKGAFKGAYKGLKGQEVEEGWGAEKQERDLEKSNAPWRPLMAKYVNDPAMSSYIKYFRIHGTPVDQAEQKAQQAIANNVKLPQWYTDIESGKAKPLGYKLSETDGGYYYEILAKKVFADNPNLSTKGRAEDLFQAGIKYAVQDLGRKRAQWEFNYDEDFFSDFVSAYGELQRGEQGVAEEYDHLRGMSRGPDFNPQIDQWKNEIKSKYPRLGNIKFADIRVAIPKDGSSVKTAIVKHPKTGEYFKLGTISYNSFRPGEVKAKVYDKPQSLDPMRDRAPASISEASSNWEDESDQADRFHQMVVKKLSGITSASERNNVAAQLSKIEQKYFDAKPTFNNVFRVMLTPVVGGVLTALKTGRAPTTQQADTPSVIAVGQRPRTSMSGKDKPAFDRTKSDVKEFLANAHDEILDADEGYELVKVVDALSRDQINNFRDVDWKEVDTEFGPMVATADILVLVNKLRNDHLTNNVESPPVEQGVADGDSYTNKLFNSLAESMQKN